MAEPPADPSVRKVARGYRPDHRLLAVVAPAGSGKTPAPEEVRRGTGAPLCRANYEEARR
jgi:hypothetical protein